MISLVFALEYESEVFRKIHTAQLCVAIWNLGVTGKRCEIPLNRHLESCKPALIVSAGFGGALQDDLPLGTLVMGINYTTPSILQHLQIKDQMRLGNIATCQKILETADEKKSLGRQTGALIGDMETAYIHKICESKGIPMLALRCVSDTVEQDMPVPASVLIDPKTCRPHPVRLFRYLLRHPAKINDLGKLIKGSRIAQHKLAGGLEGIIPQLLRKMSL